VYRIIKQQQIEEIYFSIPPSRKKKVRRRILGSDDDSDVIVSSSDGNSSDDFIIKRKKPVKKSVSGKDSTSDTDTWYQTIFCSSVLFVSSVEVYIAHPIDCLFCHHPVHGMRRVKLK
jgi:hypothetical protein